MTALTERENEVLRLKLQGLTAKEVAKQLDISPRTVEAHMSKVFEKTGETSLLKLAAKLRHV